MGAFDKAKDKAEQLKGQAKEKLGDATDNERLANEGRRDQVKGGAKEKWHDVKENADDKLGEVKDHLTGKSRGEGDRR